MGDSRRECGECRQKYDRGERCPRSLSCGHTFCTSCLDRLISFGGQRRCPSCRRPFIASTAAQLPKDFALLKGITAPTTPSPADERSGDDDVDSPRSTTFLRYDRGELRLSRPCSSLPHEFPTVGGAGSRESVASDTSGEATEARRSRFPGSLCTRDDLSAKTTPGEPESRLTQVRPATSVQLPLTNGVSKLLCQDRTSGSSPRLSLSNGSLSGGRRSPEPPKPAGPQASASSPGSLPRLPHHGAAPSTSASHVSLSTRTQVDEVDRSAFRRERYEERPLHTHADAVKSKTLGSSTPSRVLKTCRSTTTNSRNASGGDSCRGPDFSGSDKLTVGKGEAASGDETRDPEASLRPVGNYYSPLTRRENASNENLKAESLDKEDSLSTSNHHRGRQMRTTFKPKELDCTRSAYLKGLNESKTGAEASSNPTLNRSLSTGREPYSEPEKETFSKESGRLARSSTLSARLSARTSFISRAIEEEDNEDRKENRSAEKKRFHGGGSELSESDKESRFGRRLSSLNARPISGTSFLTRALSAEEDTGVRQSSSWVRIRKTKSEDHAATSSWPESSFQSVAPRMESQEGSKSDSLDPRRAEVAPESTDTKPDLPTSLPPDFAREDHEEKAISGYQAENSEDEPTASDGVSKLPRQTSKPSTDGISEGHGQIFTAKYTVLEPGPVDQRERWDRYRSADYPGEKEPSNGRNTQGVSRKEGVPGTSQGRSSFLASGSPFSASNWKSKSASSHPGYQSPLPGGFHRTAVKDSSSQDPHADGGSQRRVKETDPVLKSRSSLFTYNNTGDTTTPAGGMPDGNGGNREEHRHQGSLTSTDPEGSLLHVAKGFDAGYRRADTDRHEQGLARSRYSATQDSSEGGRLPDYGKEGRVTPHSRICDANKLPGTEAVLSSAQSEDNSEETDAEESRRTSDTHSEAKSAGDSAGDDQSKSYRSARGVGDSRPRLRPSCDPDDETRGTTGRPGPVSASSVQDIWRARNAKNRRRLTARMRQSRGSGGAHEARESDAEPHRARCQPEGGLGTDFFRSGLWGKAEAGSESPEGVTTPAGQREGPGQQGRARGDGEGGVARQGANHDEGAAGAQGGPDPQYSDGVDAPGFPKPSGRSGRGRRTARASPPGEALETEPRERPDLRQEPPSPSGAPPGLGSCDAHGALLHLYCRGCESWACDDCLRASHLPPPEGGCDVVSAEEAVVHMKMAQTEFLASRVDALDHFRGELGKLLKECDASASEHGANVRQLRLRLRREEKFLEGVESMRSLAFQKMNQIDCWEDLLRQNASRINRSSSSREIFGAVNANRRGILANITGGLDLPEPLLEES